MAKKTIRDCIVEVLSASGRAMSSQEVFMEIERRGIYEFNTKSPSNVVRSQLRRHCKNLARKDSTGGEFEMTPDGLFKLADK